MYHHRHARTVARALTPVTERRRSCGKRWFDDRIAADLALARIRACGRALHKDPVRSYSCPRCGGWHLTSIPGRPTVTQPLTKQEPMSGQEAA